MSGEMSLVRRLGQDQVDGENFRELDKGSLPPTQRSAALATTLPVLLYARCSSVSGAARFLCCLVAVFFPLVVLGVGVAIALVQCIRSAVDGKSNNSDEEWAGCGLTKIISFPIVLYVSVFLETVSPALSMRLFCAHLPLTLADARAIVEDAEREVEREIVPKAVDLLLEGAADGKKDELRPKVEAFVDSQRTFFTRYGYWISDGFFVRAVAENAFRLNGSVSVEGTLKCAEDRTEGARRGALIYDHFCGTLLPTKARLGEIAGEIVDDFPAFMQALFADPDLRQCAANSFLELALSTASTDVGAAMAEVPAQLEADGLFTMKRRGCVVLPSSDEMTAILREALSGLEGFSLEGVANAIIGCMMEKSENASSLQSLPEEARGRFIDASVGILVRSLHGKLAARGLFASHVCLFHYLESMKTAGALPREKAPHVAEAK